MTPRTAPTLRANGAREMSRTEQEDFAAKLLVATAHRESPSTGLRYRVEENATGRMWEVIVRRTRSPRRGRGR